MRITGGKAKGISLKVPRGKQTRPAMSYTREAVFSSLSDIVDGATFVDLFAGSGAYGLESISRGSRKGWFVEQNRNALDCLNSNLKQVIKSCQCKEPSSFYTIKKPVEKWLAQAPEKVDLIFIDAPYQYLLTCTTNFWDSIAQLLLPNKRARLILEAPKAFALPNNLAHWPLLKHIGKKKSQSNVFILGLPTNTVNNSYTITKTS